MSETKVVVKVDEASSYDVVVGVNLLDTIGERLREIKKTKDAQQIILLSDATVAALYKERVLNSLHAASFQVHDIDIPAGEAAKSTDVLVSVWRQLAQLGYGRDCVIVALGGGACCDTTGFVSATFMRGVTCVYLPTTLLSMVDASVGGKTAVNLPEGKNLVGTFTQPALVCADINTLATLPDNEWRSGLAEIAKSALIDGGEFYAWLKANAQTLASRDYTCVKKAIQLSVSFKARVVEADVEERKGVRESLNYGHTYGHALELLAGFATYTHGEGVAEGMRYAAELAVAQGVLSQELLAEQNDLLDKLGLEELDWHAEPASIVQAMKGDKKVRSGKLRFVLLKDIGEWSACTIEDEQAFLAVQNFLSKK